MMNKYKTDIAIERGRRVKFVRELTGMSMKEFASRCNVGLTTINYWEQAFSSLTERGAIKIVQALHDEGIHTTSLWLLQGIGDLPKIVEQSKLSKLNYPLLAPMHHQEIRDNSFLYSDEKTQNEITYFSQNNPEHLVCPLIDDAMSPFFVKEDVVGGRKLFGSNVELANGMDCIVELSSNRLLVRRVKMGSVPSNFHLYVINSEYSLESIPLFNVKIVSLAPITRVWKRNRF